MEEAEVKEENPQVNEEGQQINEEGPQSKIEDTYEESKKPKEISVEILPDDFTLYDLSFKLIIIGDSGVGKSSLTIKAAKNTFEEYYNATLGFEFFNFNLKIDGKSVRLQIWDTCGQEIYRSLISSFYRSSSLAMMMYAINE